MSPEIHQRVRKLFEEALAKPESERGAYLETACGSQPEIRQLVERLIEAHRNSQTFLAGEKAGERRLGRYVLSREIGRGSMGVVFEGIDPLIGRPVAVKVIRVDPATEADQPIRDQFFREARSAGRLLHPGIIVIFDVGQQGNAAFIAMELVDGPSLEDILERQPRLPLADTVEFLRQAAAALDYAHQNGVVHRDIKPANLMLHKGSTVKIADFGVAKISTLQNLTATGTILGTPTYMSPEQLEMQPLDGRSDQFSLAVVAYEMCTGSRPFDAPSLAPLTHLIAYGERPSARAVNPQLSETADAVLRKGLARLPAERFGTCTEFVTALGDALRPSQATVASAAVLPAAPPAAAEVPAPQPVAPPAQPPAWPAETLEIPLPPPMPAEVAARPAPASPTPVPSSMPAPAPAAAATGQPAPADTSSPSPLVQAPVKNQAVIWLLAACLGMLIILGGGVWWIYQSTPWRMWLRSSGGSKAPQTAVVPPTPPPLPSTVGALPAAPANPAPAPTVGQFSASAESIVAGNPATLRWDVQNADSVRIEPGVGPVSATGEMRIRPSESTTYTLTAKGAGGEGSASVSIAVARKPPAAAPADSARALYQSGLEERKQGRTAKALDLFRQAAEKGNVPAMLEVAEDELDSDNSESERWFRRAAELGDPIAMINLGAMYELGNHVKEDYAQAASWYRQASGKGDASATYNLARMYERGHGVPKDLAKAKELYQKAAAKGNSDARIRLDQLTDK